jgi:hypothetical protein
MLAEALARIQHSKFGVRAHFLAELEKNISKNNHLTFGLSEKGALTPNLVVLGIRNSFPVVNFWSF